jgi:hypothetical protein
MVSHTTVVARPTSKRRKSDAERIRDIVRTPGEAREGLDRLSIRAPNPIGAKIPESSCA